MARAKESSDRCAFCEIVSGRLDSAEVFRDDSVAAFLDHSPLIKGHVLVVPAVHIEVLADLPDSQLEHYFRVVRAMSVAVKEAMGSQGSFVAMNNTVSQSVPHLHTHVVPRTRGDGLRGFFWPRTKYTSAEEAGRTAESVSSAFEAEWPHPTPGGR